jgi:hypothetical protein
MRLDAIEAGGLRAFGGGDEVVAQALDLAEGQCAGAALGIVGRRERCADQLLRRPVSGMVQLHRRHRAFCLDGAGEPRQPFQMLVAEDAELTCKALADGLDMRRAGHGEGEAAVGALGQPVEFFVGQASVRMALLVGQRFFMAGPRARESGSNSLVTGIADVLTWRARARHAFADLAALRNGHPRKAGFGFAPSRKSAIRRPSSSSA